jgi:hypothetical protein
MQIDSVKLHEALNIIAIKLNHDHIDIINMLRRELCDIEAETAMSKVQEKYAGTLAGLKEK